MSNQTHDPDPFEQARKGREELAELEHRSEVDPHIIQPIDDDIEPMVETEQEQFGRQQSVRAVPATRKSFPMAGVLATGALLISVGSAAGVAYSLNQTGQLREDTGVAFTDVDDNIAALGSRLSESEVQISQVQETSDANNQQIRLLDTDQLAIGLSALRQDLAEVDAAFADSKAHSQEILQDLNQRVSELEALAQSLQQAANRAQAAPSPRRAVRTAPKPKVMDTLDGNPVVSVDQWGYNSNVVLQDITTGEFVSVAKGATVNGWRYVDADPKAQTATFAKGPQIVLVRIRG